ncbi:MAG: thiolase family protein [Planctomycetes bacterium]|nr:thiolase family protein [Planctomycetota bacterium]
MVLAAGIRTPWARSGGAFAREDAGHLGALVARELIARTHLDPGTLDEVITGIAGPPHDQANVSRVIALRADIPEHVPARTVARNCASGMEAVACAMTSIRAGDASLILALGVEVMSRYPLIFSDKATAVFGELSRAKNAAARLGAMAHFRPAMFTPRIALLEGLTDPIPGLIMGKTAELLAREFDISREDADRFALESHERARSAREIGRFAREILPLLPLSAKPGTAALEHDDSIRDGQTLEALAKLRPVFEKPDGRVTVGNSCGITDGACALLITTEERAEKLGIEPLARILSFAWAGLDPARMGLGPVYSSAKALDKAGLELEQMDVIELNEAFAAQVLACTRASESAEFCREKLGRERALGRIDPAKLNPNGGAIALGHPVGATGSRLLLSAAHELAAKKQRYALATLCIGGGQGGAFVLERSGA